MRIDQIFNPKTRTVTKDLKRGGGQGVGASSYVGSEDNASTALNQGSTG